MKLLSPNLVGVKGEDRSRAVLAAAKRVLGDTGIELDTRQRRILAEAPISVRERCLWELDATRLEQARLSVIGSPVMSAIFDSGRTRDVLRKKVTVKTGYFARRRILEAIGRVERLDRSMRNAA